MPDAPAHSLFQQIPGPGQIDDPIVRRKQPCKEFLAITLAQSRCRKDGVHSIPMPLQYLGVQRRKPRSAILVRQRNTRMHLLFVSRGMEIIALNKMPPHSVGKGSTHSRL